MLKWGAKLRILQRLVCASQGTNGKKVTILPHSQKAKFAKFLLRPEVFFFNGLISHRFSQIQQLSGSKKQRCSALGHRLFYSPTSDWCRSALVI
ncbi:hypothetical protein [Cohaesibacter sp. ES.047]|uniref:hypothetical protein n=1 Tax=Cohaesibacter sp. ES.047 TaxID=1798205 RepID=UPI0012FDD3BF|nr:hypothetical protein [Cohaesibacter sp. ES.047]